MSVGKSLHPRPSGLPCAATGSSLRGVDSLQQLQSGTAGIEAQFSLHRRQIIGKLALGRHGVALQEADFRDGGRCFFGVGVSV